MDNNIHHDQIEREESFKNSIFKINQIRFENQTRQICMQSQNGPCPLIAILNILMLKGEIILEPTTEYLTGEHMTARLVNYIIENNGDFDTIVDHFSELQTGLMVNVRFSNVMDFEDSDRLQIFRSLGIKLFHGWVMDPSVTPDYEQLRNYSYEQAAIDLVKEDNDTLSEAARLFLTDFINSNQLTYPGLCQLSESLQQRELAILFHNNHFSVIYKQQNVYLLSTDIGVSEESNVVWQLLNSINGDTELLNDNFEPVGQKCYDDAVTENSDFELAKKLALVDDYQYAKELQEIENEDIERTIQMSQQQNNAMNNNTVSSNHENQNLNSNDRTPNQERSRDWTCVLL